MKGKTIANVFDFDPDYTLLFFDDGTGLLVKVISEIAEEGLEDLAGILNPPETDTAEPEKKKSVEPEKKKDDEAEAGDEEPEGDELTAEDVAEMDFDELKELCVDNDLGTDPEDFDKDEVEELRNKVYEELEMEAPESEATAEQPEDDDMTWEDLTKLDFDELGALCDEEKLETDPEEYNEKQEDKFRRAIGEELGMEVPVVKKRVPRKK